MKKFKIGGISILLAAIFTSCAETDFEAIPANKLMGDSLTTTYTIEQLKNNFLTLNDAYSDTVNYKGGLYTADPIQADSDIVISGYITSTDAEGNVYKYFVVQEPGADGQAIKVSIDASGLSSIYPLGQKVWIRCNGLYIGRYGEAEQIGSRYVNTTKFKIKKSTGDTIYRIEPGRMPYLIAREHIHAYGMPDPTVIKPDTMTIAQIKAQAANHQKLVNKLVCIKNAFFTGKSEGDNLTDSELIFAPSTNGAGYPQLRDINDGTGEISIATSEYAKFASYPIPASTYRGDITVIVGWYRNYTDAAGAWQLTLRTIDDLGKGFETYKANIQK
ncbi:MAG TPA: DUF5689 domain-containing protein [Paludibacteraceae bacterium]|nr:DUF5689 domain-containing protein [Paludibacteraceae bacterium]